MGTPERLFDTYKPLYPSRFGPNYNPRPEADVFGRRTASPLEVKRMLDGTSYTGTEGASSTIPSRPTDGTSNRERRRMERSERIAAKRARKGK